MNLRVALPALLTLLVALPSIIEAGEPDGRWQLILRGVKSSEAPAMSDEEETAAADPELVDVVPDGDDIELVLERRGGQWVPLASGRMQPVFALVDVAEPGRVQVQVFISGRGRSNNLRRSSQKPVLATWVLEFAADAEGVITGTWREERREGLIHGRLRPLPVAVRPGPPPGEHPRFLLRKADLDALRVRAATPWGKKLVTHLDKEDWSRSSRAAGLGLLYRITGDKSYAKRAQELVLADMDSGWWDIIGPVHDPAHKVLEAVITWDLIHDACDPAFAESLRHKLRQHLLFLENYCDMDRGNGNPHSNWSAQFMSGIGMAAMALIADGPGEPPELPALEIPVVEPPAEPPVGLPVVSVGADMKQLTSYLVAGPFDIGHRSDGLAALGGELAVATGTTAVHDGLRFPVMVKERESRETNDEVGRHAIQQKNDKSFKYFMVKGDDLQPLTREVEGLFRPFPAGWICGPKIYQGAPGLPDLRVASGFRSHRTFSFAGAIEVPREMVVQIRFQEQQRVDPRIYISGRRFTVNSIVTLKPGIHSVLHPVTYTTFIGSHGRDEAIYHWLRFEEVGFDAVQLAQLERQNVNRFHQLCTEKLAGTPYADYLPHLWLAYARAKMDAWATNCISPEGWNSAGDCYTQPSLQALFAFAHAHVNATGFAMASPGNLDRVLPHQVATTVFQQDGAKSFAFGRGGGPYGPMPYARGFDFLDAALRPAVGWAAWQTLDLALAEKLTGENLVIAEFDPLSAAFALAFWPAPEAVRPPQGIVPLAAGDHVRCAWRFRNRYHDGDDAIAAISGFIHPGGDWGDVVSGEFQVNALGHFWAMRGGDRTLGDRKSEKERVSNVVRLGREVAEAYRGASYREISRTNEVDRDRGSGVVTLDLRAAGRDRLTKVIGSRSFLVDHSGASGAPVLLAVHDELPAIKPPPRKDDAAFTLDLEDTGTDSVDDELVDDLAPWKKGKKDASPAGSPKDPNAQHRWTLMTDPAHRVSVREGGFEILAADGATLQATVLAPAETHIWQEAITNALMEVNYRYDHRGNTLPRTMITVAGRESFLVVMTIQRGAAPKVSRSGDTISVGRRRIRLNGKALEFVE